MSSFSDFKMGITADEAGMHFCRDSPAGRIQQAEQAPASIIWRLRKMNQAAGQENRRRSTDATTAGAWGGGPATVRGNRGTPHARSVETRNADSQPR